MCGQHLTMRFSKIKHLKININSPLFLRLVHKMLGHYPFDVNVYPFEYSRTNNIFSFFSDCLHLQLYRDSKDRYKQGQTKASLSLQHFLGLESGFTLDKESNTVAILCQDVVVVLAFDNRERLMQWQVKLSSHLNDGPHFLVLVSSAPAKSRLPPGPARLHVQERGFCLTTGVPPRVAGHWLIANLRRYGVEKASTSC
nr:unnamed protein product [Callosobruchus analis]